MEKEVNQRKLEEAENMAKHAPPDSTFDARRQSAKRPTAQEQLAELQNAQRMSMSGQADDSGAINGFQAIGRAIGREQVMQAWQTMQKYKAGKANLEKRIIDNELWYKMRHWDSMQNDSNRTIKPVSGWLLNALANKHADAMDNFPSANVLPREEMDKPAAKMLSSVIPVVLDQAGFEGVYSDEWEYKLRSGTGVYGIFWDNSKLNGLGDITVRQLDILNLFWEPGIKDIQKSRHLFSVELMDNDLLEEMYPQLRGKLSTATVDISTYIYDDAIDTSDKSVVVDWYYKKRSKTGKTILHFCKFVNDVVLFATENDPEAYPDGWYSHGLYPVVFDPLFRTEGTPAGFGYVDIGKSAQEYIDRGNQAILENMLANTRPRHFIRNDGSVNEAEYMDLTKDLVHVDGNLGQDSIMPIQGKSLPEIYVSVINNKIDELKEVTGNRDVSTGGTTSGVTAASAIAAMIEAGSKLSRDHIKASYRVFREVVYQIIELIRQFYDIPRYFRILGNSGGEEFVQFSNAQIVPQSQGVEFGTDMGMRLPMFDIEVSAQKQSPYSKMSQNEMALQFFGAGFFDERLADQALACLEMMDFDRKEFVINRISQNGTMYQKMMMMQQQMVQMAQLLDQQNGTNYAQAMAAQFGGAAPVAANPVSNGFVPGGEKMTEPSVTRNARARVAESTAPR